MISWLFLKGHLNATVQDWEGSILPMIAVLRMELVYGDMESQAIESQLEGFCDNGPGWDGRLAGAERAVGTQGDGSCGTNG